MEEKRAQAVQWVRKALEAPRARRLGETVVQVVYATPTATLTVSGLSSIATAQELDTRYALGVLRYLTFEDLPPEQAQGAPLHRYYVRQMGRRRRVLTAHEVASMLREGTLRGEVSGGVAHKTVSPIWAAPGWTPEQGV